MAYFSERIPIGLLKVFNLFQGIGFLPIDKRMLLGMVSNNPQVKFNSSCCSMVNFFPMCFFHTGPTGPHIGKSGSVRNYMFTSGRFGKITTCHTRNARKRLRSDTKHGESCIFLCFVHWKLFIPFTRMAITGRVLLGGISIH